MLPAFHFGVTRLQWRQLPLNFPRRVAQRLQTGVDIGVNPVGGSGIAAVNRTGKRSQQLLDLVLQYIAAFALDVRFSLRGSQRGIESRLRGEYV